MCLPTSHIVKEITIGSKGLVKYLKQGSTIIDMTTGEPSITREIETKLKKNGINFLDAPVSGGPKGAKNGIIAIMVGGEKNIFFKIKPLLHVISNNVFYTGNVGSGHSLKAGNNLLNLICRVATFEVISMLVKDGIKPNIAVEVIQKVLDETMQLKLLYLIIS